MTLYRLALYPLYMIWRLDRDYIVKFLLLFVMCFVMAQLAGVLFRGGTAPAVIYLPSAIAVAALFVWGIEFWPAVALATFLSPLSSGGNPLIATGFSFAHTIQAILSVYLLKRYTFKPLLGQLNDLLVFGGICVIAAAIVPTVGYGTLYLSHLILDTPVMPFMWVNWWIGELFSLIIFGPLLIRWLAYPSPTHRTRQEWLEVAITLTAACTFAWVLFWTPFTTVIGVSMLYVLLVPLFWIALRVGPRFMTLALVLITLIALTGVVFGTRPPTSAITSIGTRILSIELFMIFIALLFLSLTSLAEERKDVMGNLRKHVNDLEDALLRISREDQAKTEFLATLAHELRNPLSPILSSLELIEKQTGSTPREYDAPLHSIKTHVHVVRKLLDDLLDISRITRKRFKLTKTTLELGPLVEQSRETVSSFLKERRHSLVIHMPKTPIWVEADPVRLQQMIVNLLYNAAKYTPEGGKVELLVQTKNESLKIAVRDNGIGIAPNMLQKIFEPFMQVRYDNKVGSGLGIGLSLTKRLVELHGGTIKAESRGIGQGSEFTLTLPLVRKVPLPMQIEKTHLRSATLRASYHVLLVDDNEAAASTLAALLSKNGHRVDTAYSGSQALKLAQQGMPQVVILDIGLPDMNGYEVARELINKHDDSHTPPVLIALTGYGQDEDKHRAYSAGFTYHLTKPVGIADLEQILRKVSVPA